MQRLVDKVVEEILSLAPADPGKNISVESIIQGVKYSDVMLKIKDSIVRRNLTKAEKKSLTSCLKVCKNKNLMRIQKYNKDSYAPNHELEFVVATAYSTNYTIGKLCGAINRKYCASHGYRFIEKEVDLLTFGSALGTRNHCTWYKIFMMLNYMKDALASSSKTQRKNTFTYLVWVDADACVVNHNVRLEDVVALGKYRDLIIAEDQVFLVNCGVMLIRVCEWSFRLLNEVWKEKNYFTVPHFEQSALIRVLRRQAEGLNLISPEKYFSKKGGDPVKYFVHTAVLSPSLLNTNVHDDECNDGTTNFENYRSVFTYENQNSGQAMFIYHPYGKARKVELVKAMMSRRKIKVDGFDVSEVRTVKINKGYVVDV